MSVSANPTWSMAGPVSVRWFWQISLMRHTPTHEVELERSSRTMLSSYMSQGGIPALGSRDVRAVRTGHDDLRGDVAQLGERLVCNQEVDGSIPLVST